MNKTEMTTDEVLKRLTVIAVQTLTNTEEFLRQSLSEIGKARLKLEAVGGVADGYRLARSILNGSPEQPLHNKRRPSRRPNPTYDWTGVDWSKTSREIAATLGCTTAAVHRHRQLYTLQCPKCATRIGVGNRLDFTCKHCQSRWSINNEDTITAYEPTTIPGNDSVPTIPEASQTPNGEHLRSGQGADSPQAEAASGLGNH